VLTKRTPTVCGAPAFSVIHHCLVSNAGRTQIVLWYLDSGCSKHMTGDRSRLKNFVEKFIGTVRFGNDHFGSIMGYGDYVFGDSVISRVYYVEGLGHIYFLLVNSVTLILKLPSESTPVLLEN
jgi:hypothetical protein